MKYIIALLFLISCSVASPQDSLSSRQHAPEDDPRIVKIDNHCTGFILEEDVVVTANHCVAQAIEEKRLEVEVGFTNGETGQFYLAAHGETDHKDYAILFGETGDRGYLMLSPEPPQAYDLVYAQGYGNRYSLTDHQEQALGVLLPEDPEDMGYMTMACHVVGGDSGSPLFNEMGEVIGINVRSGDPIPFALAVRIEWVTIALEQIKAQNKKAVGQ